MGGFHFFDIIIVAAIALALFGPKALQSMARSAGKGLGQAKDMKDKLLSELPVEDITKVTDHIPQIPLNSRQAVEMLLKTDEKKEKETTKEANVTEKSSEAEVEKEKDQEVKTREAD